MSVEPPKKLTKEEQKKLAMLGLGVVGAAIAGYFIYGKMKGENGSYGLLESNGADLFGGAGGYSMGALPLDFADYPEPGGGTTVEPLPDNPIYPTIPGGLPLTFTYPEAPPEGQQSKEVGSTPPIDYSPELISVKYPQKNIPYGILNPIYQHGQETGRMIKATGEMFYQTIGGTLYNAGYAIGKAARSAFGYQALPSSKIPFNLGVMGERGMGTVPAGGVPTIKAGTTIGVKGDPAQYTQQGNIQQASNIGYKNVAEILKRATAFKRY